MKKILIDCDTGIDDSLAILYALKSKSLHIEGITTGFGNTGALQAAENVLRLIQLANPGYEIPVAIGAEETLLGKKEDYPIHIHGKNGIGDVELPKSNQVLSKESAWEMIVRKAGEMPGELTLVTLGRLTNLAKALELDPELPQKLKNVVVMGGCVKAPGNISPYAEANIGGDAEASDIVFQAGFHMMVVGLDVTTKTYVHGQDLEKLSKYCKEENLPIVRYLQEALKLYFRFHHETMGMMDESVVHDPLAMVLADCPSLGTYKIFSARVDTTNSDTRGMIKIDERFCSEIQGSEILFCLEVDGKQAVNRLLSVF